MIGKTFGYSTVIAQAGGGKNSSWLVRCVCGNERVVDRPNLKKGNSCGCQRPLLTSIRRKRHGETGSRLWTIWVSMRQRAGRRKYWLHVDVCPEWESYEIFRDWALANGYEDRLTIDRRDGEKGYYPDNCRWVTYLVQRHNRRSL
jgi:hypothetical protein